MNFEEFSKEYGRSSRRGTAIILGVGILAIVAVFLRIPLGPYTIGYFDALDVFFEHLMGTFDGKPLDEYVVWDNYAPRSIAALAIGSGLGVCGAAMQSALKNPLADPYMTGIASGANLGISLAVILNFNL